jgi:hypothetical protein
LKGFNLIFFGSWRFEMSIKFLQASALAMIVGLAPVNIQAASIWLDPVSQAVTGGIVSVNVWADASDVGGFLAGGLDLFYDSSVLTCNGDFAFDAAFPTDPAFSRTGDNCFVDPSIAGCAVSGEMNGIAFGSFTGLASAGPTQVGSLSFAVTSLDIILLSMADNDFPAGVWYATDGSGPLDVVYGSTGIIPIPAAVWLFGTGLLGLLGFAKKRKGLSETLI